VRRHSRIREQQVAVRRVNDYLIEDKPLTLPDAGPESGTSFDGLRRGIDRLGHALEDIKR
jgi:hypothetical protein